MLELTQRLPAVIGAFWAPLQWGPNPVWLCSNYWLQLPVWNRDKTANVTPHVICTAGGVTHPQLSCRLCLACTLSNCSST
jgi:hypothetical protein